MSNCGSCRSGLCTCFITGDNVTVEVRGNGSIYQPFRAAAIDSFPRAVGLARRVLLSQSITANTDTAVVFDENGSILGENMWDPLFPTRLTFIQDGLYLIGGAAQGTNNAAFVWDNWIALNGNVSTPLVRRTVSNAIANKRLFNDVMTLHRFTAGDYIELYVRANDNVVLTLVGGDGTPGLDTPAYPYIYANWIDE